MSTSSMRLTRGVPLTVAALLLAGCMTGGVRHPTARDLVTRSGEPEQLAALLDTVVAAESEQAERAPRVALSVESVGLSGQQLEITFRTSEHAHVLVGMVGRDGHVSVLFPGDPGERHLVRGGVRHRMQDVFAGFAVPPVSAGLGYGLVAFQEYLRNTGYVFAIASNRPLDLEALDALGWWDTYELTSNLRWLEPRLFSYRVAGAIVSRGARYSVTWEQLEGSAASTTFALASAMSYSCARFAGRGAPLGWYDPHNLISTYGYELSQRCPTAGRYTYAIGRAPVATPPRIPTDSTGDDSGKGRERANDVVRRFRQGFRNPSMLASEEANRPPTATSNEEVRQRLREHRAVVLRERMRAAHHGTPSTTRDGTHWARPLRGSGDEGGARTSAASDARSAGSQRTEAIRERIQDRGSSARAPVRAEPTSSVPASPRAERQTGSGSPR